MLIDDSTKKDIIKILEELIFKGDYDGTIRIQTQ
jgi:hypothetical protein